MLTISPMFGHAFFDHGRPERLTRSFRVRSPPRGTVSVGLVRRGMILDMISELDLQGQVRLRFGRRDQFVLYKSKDESARHFLLKAAAYALFFREHEGLTFEPKLRFKFPADLATVDLSGEATFWIVVDDVNLTRLDYTCRHVHAPIALILQVEDLDAAIASIRKSLHYRYTHNHLTLYNFVMPAEEWLDPEDIAIPSASYDVFHF